MSQEMIISQAGRKLIQSSVIKVAVLHNWAGSGPRKQWPGLESQEDIQFTFDVPITLADYVFVLNDVSRPVLVKCDPSRVWGFIQEPPTEIHKQMQVGRPFFARVFTTDESLSGLRYRHFWGALQWATGLSYDELRSERYPDKTVQLAWVTSNLTDMTGHRKRMAFLDVLRAQVPQLQLHGRGFRPVARKWDALSPARYSIAFENFGGGIYWSEKLADCFLSYSTPIYYGARDIERYFPKNSYVPFDPDDPLAIDRIRDIIASDFHEQNRDALLEARELCLTKYNTLFFLAGLAQEHFKEHGPSRNRKWMRLLPAHPNPLHRRILKGTRGALLNLLPQSLIDFVRRIKGRFRRR